MAGIRKYFVNAQESREQAAIESARRHAEWLKQMEERERLEAIRLQKDKERKHAEALSAAAHARKADLLKAADNWRQSAALNDFIAACEARWANQTGGLTTEQNAWLIWAKEIAVATSPFSAAYPDPAIDGAFDPTVIPLGGPYPRTRNFK